MPQTRPYFAQQYPQYEASTMAWVDYVCQFLTAGVDDIVLRRHNTSPILHRLGCGVQATHNISMNDLTVVLVLGRN